jgi:SAM-dependent methyltransferase
VSVSPRDLRLAYDRDAASYEERFAALQAVKYDAVLARCTPTPSDRVLDLGCGTGMLLRRLSGLETPPVGLDLSAGMLEGAPGRRVQASLLAPPFAPRSFDVVFAITSLLVSPRQAAWAFAEVSRLLVPGGRLALTVLASEGVYEGLEDDLRASGMDPFERFACGQDVGWICRRV